MTLYIINKLNINKFHSLIRLGLSIDLTNSFDVYLELIEMIFSFILNINSLTVNRFSVIGMLLEKMSSRTIFTFYYDLYEIKFFIINKKDEVHIFILFLFYHLHN